MASRAVIGGIVDERAVVTKKEDEEENARVGGEGIDPGLVDELYESLRDAVRRLWFSRRTNGSGYVLCVLSCLSRKMATILCTDDEFLCFVLRGV
jgi:hypothetical protein